MNVVPLKSDISSRIDAALAENPDGILEMIATKCAVSLWQVFQCLPEGQVVCVTGDRFEALWAEMTKWGSVLFIVHTDDIVLECEGALPPGTSSHGYFNIHGDSPIGATSRPAIVSALSLSIGYFMAAARVLCNS